MNKALVGGIIAAIVIGVAIGAFFISPSSDTESPTQIRNEKLGLIVNTPAPATTIEELSKVYAQATSTGVGRNNLYLFWNLIEPEKGQYNWEQSDVLMSFNKQNDLKVTLYFSLINGKTLGPFPDWIGKPSLVSISEDSVVKVLDAILSRYHIIDSVIISGDTDAQFRHNEKSIPLYQELFDGVYERLKEKHPDVKIGNGFSLHGVINKNLGHIVKELNVGDFVAFTYFPVDNVNEINKTPQQARADLEKIFELVPNKKVGLFEISWSTSDFVGGNQAEQAEFMATTFDFYAENESKFVFLTWYRQYDRPEGTCVTDPAVSDDEDTLSVGGSGFGSSEHVIERLDKYICNAGLINTEGIPKQGWHEFSKLVQMSTNS